jgi:hypothetical protein
MFLTRWLLTATLQRSMVAFRDRLAAPGVGQGGVPLIVYKLVHTSLVRNSAAVRCHGGVLLTAAAFAPRLPSALHMESTRAPRADLFDPAALGALGHLEVVARWIVDGFLSGLHRSPRKGFSVEFADFRPYQPGDDLRYVDWKIAARSDRWVVKQYEEETNLRATIVLDVSRSMDWRGAPAEARVTKRAYAEQLAAALALLLLRQRDAVGLIRFDDAVRTSVPPRARTGQWRRIVAALAEQGNGRASDLAAALGQAARLVTRRGMVILLSDLLVDVDAAVPALRGLRAAGHDVTVLHIMDPAERDFTLAGEARYTDPESELDVPAAAADVRVAYRSTVDQVIGEWKDALGAIGAGYELVLTDQPYAIPLRHAFGARERRA